MAGVLVPDGGVTTFAYGRSYLGRAEAVPRYLPELPLVAGAQQPGAGEVAGCIADAASDVAPVELRATGPRCG